MKKKKGAKTKDTSRKARTKNVRRKKQKSNNTTLRALVKAFVKVYATPVK